ncbi:hypothetical protein HMPREF0666_00783 [Prevotella sp. C561]|nr:hypothetical protein HMPREF0666_00783 [Prevotella sp. C561]
MIINIFFMKINSQGEVFYFGKKEFYYIMELLND